MCVLLVGSSQGLERELVLACRPCLVSVRFLDAFGQTCKFVGGRGQPGVLLIVPGRWPAGSQLEVFGAPLSARWLSLHPLRAVCGRDVAEPALVEGRHPPGRGV